MKIFLQNCSPVFQDESEDFKDVVKCLTSSRVNVIFQPAVFPDFEPMYYWTCDKGAQLLSGRKNVFLVPLGNDSIKRTVAKIVDDFYIKDELPDYSNKIGFDLELCQMILLNYPSGGSFLHCDLKGVSPINVIYIELLVNERKKARLFLFTDPADVIWECYSVHCGERIDILIDAEKGFVHNPFENSDLYYRMLSFSNKALLPTLLMVQYGRVHEAGFKFLWNVRVYSNDYYVYLTPWASDEAICSKVEIILREKEEHVEKTRNALEHCINHTGCSVPLDDLRELFRQLLLELGRGGGKHDYESCHIRPVYSNSSIFESRRQLFLTGLLMYLYEPDASNKTRVWLLLRSIVDYHSVIMTMQPSFNLNGMHILIDADNDLDYFVDRSYQVLKNLSGNKDFAYLVCHMDYNHLEESLLKAAYRHGDIDFANWIIDNGFYGAMQTELFSIICKNDIHKAVSIVPHLRPRCMTWILTDTYVKPNVARGNQRISQETEVILKNIDQQTVTQIIMCIPRAERPGFKELLNKYFPGSL